MDVGPEIALLAVAVYFWDGFTKTSRTITIYDDEFDLHDVNIIVLYSGEYCIQIFVDIASPFSELSLRLSMSEFGHYYYMTQSSFIEQIVKPVIFSIIYTNYSSPWITGIQMLHLSFVVFFRGNYGSVFFAHALYIWYTHYLLMNCWSGVIHDVEPVKKILVALFRIHLTSNQVKLV